MDIEQGRAKEILAHQPDAWSSQLVGPAKLIMEIVWMSRGNPLSTLTGHHPSFEVETVGWIRCTVVS